MKTLIIIPVFIFIFSLNSIAETVNLPAVPASVTMTEEEYVNDIPFNTSDIASGTIINDMNKKYSDEDNVEDIPFDTRKIALEAGLKEIMDSDTEAYVNDIPFNTREVYYNVLVEFYAQNYMQEENVNDIPFSTTEIVCQYLVNKYQNEKTANDIHFDTYAISNEAKFENNVDNYRNEKEVCDMPVIACDPICKLTRDYRLIQIKNATLTIEKPLSIPDVKQFEQNIDLMELERMLEKLNDWEMNWNKMTLE